MELAARAAYTHDALNRVLTAETEKADETVVYSVDYGYDLVGNRLTIDEASLQTDDAVVMRNLRYAYDSRYQLKSEDWGGTAADPEVYYRYNYDLAGNRTEMFHSADFGATEAVTAYAYNARNEIATATTDAAVTTYFHDPNGNREAKTAGTATAKYVYDVNDRLVAVDTDYDGVAVWPEFEATYDYRTRRVTKAEKENGALEVTTFRYDGGVSFQEWKDTDGDGTPEKQVEFLRGSGMGGGIGSILYSDRAPETAGNPNIVEYFVYSPAVGHVTATVREDASVKSTNLYEAFGSIAISSGTSDNNRLANTKERDASIALDNHGFRYYDTEIGRYTTRDPIGYGDGMNVYLSVLNNPINFTDPLGLNGDDLLTFALGRAGEWWGIEFGVSGPEGQEVGEKTAQQVKVTGRVLKGVVQEEAARLEHAARHPREALKKAKEAVGELYGQAETGVKLAGEDPKRAALLLKDAAIRKAEQLKELPEWAMEHPQEYQAAVTRLGAEAVIAAGKAKIVAGAAKVGGKVLVTMNRHHPLPRFLGGASRQTLSRVPKPIHNEFHRQLRAELKKVGFPKRMFGRGPASSARAWAKHMRRNPGSQRTAFDAVLKVSRQVDRAHGTNITQDVWRNVMEDAFKAHQ